MSDSEYSEPLDVNGPDEGDMHMQLLQQQQQQQFETQQQNLSYMSYAGSTSSSGESSISTTSSDESEENDEGDTLELAKVTNEVLSLPRGLCENAAIFKEFFSLETWQELPLPVQTHLKQFLPRFNQVLPTHMAEVEQTRTISMLFNNQLTCFGESPLMALQRQLEVGNFRPDIRKLRENIKKSRRREQKFQQCERLSQMAKQLFISRHRLLDVAYKSSPDTVIKPAAAYYPTQKPKASHLFGDNKISAVRARKRFYTEISQLAQQLGLKEDVVLSADEEDDDAEVAEEMKRDQQLQQRNVENESETVKPSNSLADRCIYSTIFKKHQDMDDEEALRLQQKTKQSKLTNRSFRYCLREHKRRKITEPTLPEFETSDIRLRDVCARAQMGGNFKRMFAFGKTTGRKSKLTLTSTTATTPAAPKTCSTATLAPTNATTSYTSSTTCSTSTLTATVTQPLTLKTLSLKLPPPPPKLSEPPALVPIQPTLKKPEAYQLIAATVKSPQQHLQQQKQQQLQMQHHSLAKLNNSNNSNETLNIAQLMSVANHTDNINLCMDDSSLLAGDHDAFNMLDNEVELQQEEVETFGGTCEETIPAFVIGNDVVMPSSVNNNKDSQSSLLNARIAHHPQQQKMDSLVVSQPMPKLEPISRTPSMVTSSSGSELIQETHACYFSLIRDFFCSTPNHRMRYDDLRHKIDVWLRNPITALNEWYSYAENWSNLLKSAINFLVGEFPDLPDEYVPYIEHKVQLNIYQWIGAGRDSDNRLTDLCTLWIEKRKHAQHGRSNVSNLTYVTQNELQMDLQAARSIVESEDSHEADSDNGGGLTPPPPPPRCPTSWTVRAATVDEIKEFQRQERERFEQPHKAYTYRMHGYESVVGPVKGIYSPLLALSKARGHSMMVGDRPNFVTILTLVRDATARLPNGEGTRAQISELLKCSQYINRDASENVLQTIVSGALDRMHTEHDPCVRYEPKRKIWIYLHRNRSEDDFERIHLQNQTAGKSKKLPQRKPKPTTVDNDNFSLLASSDTSNGSSANCSLITMPALVPSNPIIVTNSSKGPQRHQQIVNANKCPPVPPLKYHIPPPQTISGSQQKSLLKSTVRADNKTTSGNNNNSVNLIKHSFQMPQNKSGPNQNTTPIIVATPQGLQTVHVSNATSVMPAQSCKQQQQTQQQQTSNMQQRTTNITANLGGKRVTLNKPIIINQITATSSSGAQSSFSPSNTSTSVNSQKLKQQQQQVIQKTQLVQNRITLQTNQHQLLTQQQQQSNLIIPISMANNMTLNHVTTSNVTDSSSAVKQSKTSGSGQSPSTLSNKQNIIRLVPASNVKTLINSPQSNTTQIVNRHRIVTATTSNERPNTPQQQQKLQTTGLQLLSNNGNVLTVSSGAASSSQAGSIVKMSPQQFATLHQKPTQQQPQHVVVKQTGITKPQTSMAGTNKPQRIILGNTSIMGQTGQGKNIVLQQIPVSSSSIVVTPSQTTTVSSATTSVSGNKIQTINAKSLTPQQQRILIQNLKQQQQNQQTINQNQIQFKTVQVVGNNSASQTNMMGRAQAITMATTAAQQNTAKAAVVIVSQDNGTTTQQQHQPQQTVTRILKTSSPQLKSEMTASTVGTRLITSSSGQVISLDSLIQKQGGALRITGTGNATQTLKTNQQHLTANIVHKSQQQQQQQVKQQQPQQFAIVSVPNSIISLGSNSNFTVGQRIVTTQAGSSNTTSLINLDTTKVTPSIVATESGRVVTATAAGTKIITKQAPAIAGAGNVRVINAVSQTANVNLAKLQGKQVVLATGKTFNTITKAPQQQNYVQTQQGSIVIGGQTVKLQPGNTNIQQLFQKSGNIINSQTSNSNLTTTTTTTPQMQTVIMGNQILRVQQLPQIVSTANRLNVSNTTKTISNSMDNNSVTTKNSNAPKTIFVGSTGQTLRLQPAACQTQAATNKNVIVQAQQQKPTSKTAASGNVTTPNRVVLAVQGGGQIFLSPNFQGGNINLKSLQNMRVVSLAQHPSTKVKDTTSASAVSSSTTAQHTILKTTSNTTTTTRDTNV